MFFTVCCHHCDGLSFLGKKSCIQILFGYAQQRECLERALVWRVTLRTCHCVYVSAQLLILCDKSMSAVIYGKRGACVYIWCERCASVLKDMCRPPPRHLTWGDGWQRIDTLWRWGNAKGSHPVLTQIRRHMHTHILNGMRLESGTCFVFSASLTLPQFPSTEAHLNVFSLHLQEGLGSN